jgi:hypothetical protein
VLEMVEGGNEKASGTAAAVFISYVAQAEAAAEKRRGGRSLQGVSEQNEPAEWRAARHNRVTVRN